MLEHAQLSRCAVYWDNLGNVSVTHNKYCGLARVLRPSLLEEECRYCVQHLMIWRAWGHGGLRRNTRRSDRHRDGREALRQRPGSPKASPTFPISTWVKFTCFACPGSKILSYCYNKMLTLYSIKETTSSSDCCLGVFVFFKSERHGF